MLNTKILKRETIKYEIKKWKQSQIKYLTRRVQRILECTIVRSEIVERTDRERGNKNSNRVSPLPNGALCCSIEACDSFIFFIFTSIFRWSTREKRNPRKGRKSKKKKKIEGATRGRINNAAREERGGLAELYVSKAASRVMTRRPIHVRYLGHTWILIHAAIAAAVD